MISIAKTFLPRKNIVGLSVLTAAMLALSFPPIPTGILAFVGFVPFLILVDRFESYWRLFRYSYFTFFLFSVFTLYWVAGFTHFKDPYLMFAGIALFLWQPLFFSIPVSVYYFVRKLLPEKYSIYAFPFIWICFEWLYALGEFAFPWLTIGNTQTYDLEKIQFIEFTGVYGLSFWVLIINVLIFQLLYDDSSKKTKRRTIILSLIVFLYFTPNVLNGLFVQHVFPQNSEKSITMGIVQPNIDPWDKWEGANTFSGRWKQVEEYLRIIGNYRKDSLDMIVLPESAILLNLPAFPEHFTQYRNVIDSLEIAVLSGYARFQYYEPDKAPASSNKVKGSTLRWDSFNSIFFVEPEVERFQSYSKMRLVPFAERIPYAESVPFLIEPLRWGVGISNWGIGEDSTLFESRKNSSKFLAMVCYESIFPEFVASFVNRGAEYLVFITNDSWWGNTSGARQHMQYAVLRAIENRRWVVRCANGGISAFIDPMGKTYEKTDMYVQTFIKHEIVPRSDRSFYTQHGDWFARICASIAVIFILITIVYQFSRK